MADESRKAPSSMPKTPEELLAFVSWPDYYDGETLDEYKARQTLCETLGKRYAQHMKQKVGALMTKDKPAIWLPK